MRRSRGIFFLLALAASVGCNTLAGIGDFEDVPCNGECPDVGDDSSADDSSATGDARDAADTKPAIDSTSEVIDTGSDGVIDTSADVAPEVIADSDDASEASDASDDATDATDATDAADAVDGSDVLADGDAPFDAADTSDTAPADSGDAGGCPFVATPLVTITAATSYSIERTEVTRAQYDAFLKAKGGDTSGQPSACGWNGSYRPTGWTSPSGASCSLPVVQVDWCDAAAYCKWAGRSLCGKIGGGSPTFSDFDDKTKSQWYRVCSNAADTAYTYGVTYAAGKCVDSAFTPAGAQAVGSLATCTGTAAPFNGVLDMSGNVREWEDSCRPSFILPLFPQNDDCHSRGGDFNDTAHCNDGTTENRNATTDDVGIRCCAP